MSLKRIFFHIWKDGRPEYQGRLLEVRPDRKLHVLFYSWLDGAPNGEKVIPCPQMMTLYKSDDDMRFAWIDYMCTHEGADRAFLESCDRMFGEA